MIEAALLSIHLPEEAREESDRLGYMNNCIIVTEDTRGTRNIERDLMFLRRLRAMGYVLVNMGDERNNFYLYKMVPAAEAPICNSTPGYQSCINNSVMLRRPVAGRYRAYIYAGRDIA